MSEKPLTTEDLHRQPTDQDLTRLQRTTVLYYLHETNPDNGLVRDKTHPDIPCSIAAVGMALATIPVVVGRQWLFGHRSPHLRQPSVTRTSCVCPSSRSGTIPPGTG